MKMILLFLCLISGIAYADTPPPGTVRIKDTNGNPIIAADGSISVGVSAGANGTAVNNTSVGSGSATIFTAPSGCIGFILEAESSNSANVRWAIGSTATILIGAVAEPGRDTGFVPSCAALSVISFTGTQAVDVIWVQR